MDQHVDRRGWVTSLTRPPARTGRVESESRAFGAMRGTLADGKPTRGRATPADLLAVTHPTLGATALSSLPSGRARDDRLRDPNSQLQEAS